MKKTYRRLLLFVSVVAFLSLAPLVILYAVGYRTDLQAVDPLPVGVILVETTPSRADVYVNDQYIGRSPQSISNLPPGRVTVRVAKAGYREWQKTVTVQPRQATEVRDILLIPERITSTELARNVRLFSLSPNRQLLAVVHDNNMISIIDRAGDVIVQPTRMPVTPDSLLWSPNSNAVAIRSRQGSYYSLAAINQARPQPLPTLLYARDVVWDPRIPGRLLYVTQAHQLEALNITTAGQAILATNVQRFATSSRYLYVMHRDETFATYSLQGNPVDLEVPVPDGELSDLYVTPRGDIAYLLDNGDLLVVDEEGELRTVASSVVRASWAPSGEILMAMTDQNSVYVYNVFDERTPLPRHELQLIARLSRHIKDPQWFAGSRHLVYQVDDEIWITEIDARDHPITYQIDTTNLGSSLPTVGEDGETLFYVKSTDRIPRLVAAPLLSE